MHRTGYRHWSIEVKNWREKKVMEWSENNAMQILLMDPMNKISQIYISSVKVLFSPFSTSMHAISEADRPVVMASVFSRSRDPMVSSSNSSKKRRKNIRFNNKWWEWYALAIAMRVSFLMKKREFISTFMYGDFVFLWRAHKACAVSVPVRGNAIKASFFASVHKFYPWASKNKTKQQ